MDWKCLEVLPHLHLRNGLSQAEAAASKEEKQGTKGFAALAALLYCILIYECHATYLLAVAEYSSLLFHKRFEQAIDHFIEND